jgi:hypothetical protein
MCGPKCNYDEKRLIDATHLEKEMREYARYIGRETTNECESTAECCADMVSEAPTIDLEKMIPAWRSPDKDPPKVEEEVLILYCNSISGYGITTAHYENGNVLSQNSAFYWEDLWDWGLYDEEQDDYRIPEGWWEYRHFNPDEVFNNRVDYPVVGWMPLPPKEVDQNG